MLDKKNNPNISVNEPENKETLEGQKDEKTYTHPSHEKVCSKLKSINKRYKNALKTLAE